MTLLQSSHFHTQGTQLEQSRVNHFQRSKPHRRIVIWSRTSALRSRTSPIAQFGSRVSNTALPFRSTLSTTSSPRPRSRDVLRHTREKQRVRNEKPAAGHLSSHRLRCARPPTSPQFKGCQSVLVLRVSVFCVILHF